MTWELQSTLQASWIRWPALRNHIPCMAQVIQHALGAFTSNLSVKSRTKSWEAPERDQQFGKNESTKIGKIQRLWREGNATINKGLAMRPGLTKIIAKVRICRYFEWPETNLHIAENACCVDYADTWSSKWVDWLSRGENTTSSTSYYGSGNMVEFSSEVAWVSITITRIQPGEAEEY